LIAKLIEPPVGSPERNSLSSWRTLWSPLDPTARDQRKLGPFSKLRVGGFFGEKKSSATSILRGAAPATAGSASTTAAAEMIKDRRTASPPELVDRRIVPLEYDRHD
jgi:hypothetical protein